MQDVLPPLPSIQAAEVRHQEGLQRVRTAWLFLLLIGSIPSWREEGRGGERGKKLSDCCVPLSKISLERSFPSPAVASCGRFWWTSGSRCLLLRIRIQIQTSSASSEGRGRGVLWAQ